MLAFRHEDVLLAEGPEEPIPEANQRERGDGGDGDGGGGGDDGFV